MRCVVVSFLFLECLHASTIFKGEKVYQLLPQHKHHVDVLHGLAHGDSDLLLSSHDTDSTDNSRVNAEDLVGLDFWGHPAPGEPISVRVPARSESSFLTLMESIGVQPRAVIEDIPELLEKEWRRDVRRYSLPPENSQNIYDQKLLRELDASASDANAGVPVSPKSRRVLLQEDLNRLKQEECSDGQCCEQYQSYDEIVEWMKLMRDTYHFVSVIEIGLSYEGRMIYAIEINANPEQHKPKVVLDGAIHAREWASPATVMWLAENLIASIGNKTSMSEVSMMATEATWVLAPVFNPDGYEYARTTNRMWRKNRQPNNGSTCAGTDLCRNCDAGFGGPGSSASTCQETYHGPEAWSAPETLAFKNFFDAQTNLKLYINFHAYSQLWLMPYGYTQEKCRDHDELMRVSEKIQAAIMEAEGKEYRIGPAATTIYPASGIMSDYVYDSVGVKYSFAVELRPLGGSSFGFQLPADQICSMGREILAALKVLIGQIMREWRGL